jgi:hypothetical protein
MLDLDLDSMNQDPQHCRTGFKYFKPKKLFLSSQKYDRDVHPDPGSGFFPHPGSQGPGSEILLFRINQDLAP